MHWRGLAVGLSSWSFCVCCGSATRGECENTECSICITYSSGSAADECNFSEAATVVDDQLLFSRMLSEVRLGHVS